MKKDIIIFDVDGVLLKWESNLPFFCLKNGIDPVHACKAYSAANHLPADELFGVSDPEIGRELIRKYNLGDTGRYLAAFEDAVAHIHKLSKKYDLVALTSFGVGTEYWLNRKFNLEAFFPNCFKDLICIDLGESKIPYVQDIINKHESLKQKVVAFVDDQSRNTDEIRRWSTMYNKNIVVVKLNRNCADSDITDMGDLDKFIEANRK